MATYNVGYFVGSLANASINRKLALALMHLAPKELQLKEIPFADLPLYSYPAFCNSPLMNSIEAYIQFTPGLFTDNGELADDSVAEFLRNYMAEFHGFITRVYTALPRNA